MAKIAEIVKASADPAANNEIVYTADEDMIVHALTFQLTTDANVANRTVGLVGDDGTGAVGTVVFFKSHSTFAHAASIVGSYTAFEGAPLSTGIYLEIPLPVQGLRLRKGDRLSTQTVNRQVGDDFGVMRLQIERQ